MTLADVSWALMYMVGVIGGLAMLDEAFPRLWPWLCRQLRSRWLNRRARNRHPIIKDWK